MYAPLNTAKHANESAACSAAAVNGDINGKAKRLNLYDFDENNPNDLTRRAVDNLRPMKVIVLGTGMSGIIAGTFFPREIENLELVIYDKNEDLGGTWYESV
jgi:hypothetical protein